MSQVFNPIAGLLLPHEAVAWVLLGGGQWEDADAETTQLSCCLQQCC